MSASRVCTACRVQLVAGVSSKARSFMKLRALLEMPTANCTLHPVQTRDAMIDYFRRHNVVHKITRVNDWAQAS